MQKTVTASLTRSVDSKTDGHAGMVTAAYMSRTSTRLKFSQPKSDDGTDVDVA